MEVLNSLKCGENETVTLFTGNLNWKKEYSRGTVLLHDHKDLFLLLMLECHFY